MHPRTETREGGELDVIVEQAYRELENARHIAQTIIANARHEAGQTVDRARTQAARAAAIERDSQAVQRTVRDRQQEDEARHAYEQGFEEGLAKGTEEGRRRFETLVAKVGGILDHLGHEREQVMSGYRQEMIELILQICERVIRVEKDAISALLGENLQLLLEEAVGSEEAVLHLNPSDLEEVARHLEEHGGALPRHRLRADPLVPAGECRIRGKGLNLDLSFARRFEAIRDRLRARFGRGLACERSTDRADRP